MANKSLSKEELLARLKAIASDNSPRIENFGAMCYSQMSPPEKHFKCDVCGTDTSYSDWNNHDVKVETVCESCAEKVKKEVYPDMKSPNDDGFDWDKDIWLSDINHIFYFKTTSDTEYHRAIANYWSPYKALLTLFQNKPMYYDSYDASHYIADEIETLEFMTGIKFDV